MKGFASCGGARLRSIGVALALAAPLAAAPAQAQDAAAEADVPAQLRRQAEHAAQQDELIARQAREIEALRKAVAGLREAVERAAATPAGAGPAPVAAAQPAPAAAPAPVGQALEKDVPEANATVSSISERASVLTPLGHWSIEPSLQYTYSSKDQVSILGVSILPAITVGLIDVERISQTTDLAALTLRYGLAPRSELELRLPYLYADQDTVGRPFGSSGDTDITTGAHGHGIGDVELAVRHQFGGTDASLPYLIGEARVRAPTGRGPFSVPLNANTGLPEAMPSGTGFWGLFGALTAIQPTEPAVLFGSINYLLNIGRDVSDVGYVRPGNSIGLNFGTGIALNETTSLSIGYEQDWLSKTTEGGVTLPSTTGIQVGRLLIGYSYRLSARTTVNASLAIGATDAAPNTQLTLRVPVSF